MRRIHSLYGWNATALFNDFSLPPFMRVTQRRPCLQAITAEPLMSHGLF